MTSRSPFFASAVLLAAACAFSCADKPKSKGSQTTATSVDPSAPFPTSGTELPHAAFDFTMPGTVTPPPKDVDDGGASVTANAAGFGDNMVDFTCLESRVEDNGIGFILFDLKNEAGDDFEYRKKFAALCAGKITAAMYDLDPDQSFVLSYSVIDSTGAETAKGTSKPFILKDELATQGVVPVVFD